MAKEKNFRIPRSTLENEEEYRQACEAAESNWRDVPRPPVWSWLNEEEWPQEEHCGCGCDHDAHDGGNGGHDGCGHDHHDGSDEEDCGCDHDHHDHSCEDEDDGCDGDAQSCCRTLAMPYVMAQKWTARQKLYTLHRALTRGTLFPQLDLPFCAKGGPSDE